MATDVISTAFTIVQFIIKWKKEYDEASESLRTMGATVQVVQHALVTLDPVRHPSLESPLKALVDCLNETKDILVANTTKKQNIIKKIIFPGSVTKKMTDLEDSIIKLVTIMNLAVGATNLNVSAKSEDEINKAKALNALEFIKHAETKKFWKEFFGETVYTVDWPDLEKAFAANYPDFVDSVMLCDLQLCLDNLNSGYISCHRLSDFCGTEPLSRRLSEYKERVKPRESIPLSPQPGHVTYPLLLWVDDRPENNEKEIAHARSKGICTVTLQSTAEAKQWIVNHPDVMEVEEPEKVHIITDNAREGKGTVLDINAGEDMIRFVRGRRSAAPILVYCGDLDYTKYTNKYKACRAVNKRLECVSFIDELK